MLGRVAVCALALALAACASMPAQAVGGALLLRDYGVKLCGREFVRAVIFTCGGSRWKRLPHADLAFQWKPHSDIATKSQQSTFPSRNLSQHTSSTYFTSNFPAELLTRHGAPSKSDKPELFRDSGVLAKEVWPRSSSSRRRTRRHFSQGVAGICCSQGCTKNDIGRLC
ncbi:prorelaxin H1 isoform X2 [Syngnathoides biaculeatus]|uniref:prorelaxin H1 isoform X2 n=1 Tax=Syngnathoides biaculeatus TaxID=300417 RepID=UPI002ADE6598|nr:prorelaxin H1 isoform X2 [Syngnathoides biaculeatus]